MKDNINIKNRKATFEYAILTKYIAGIQLTGTEIKSVREGKVSIGEAFCYFEKNCLWVKGMNISPCEKASYYNHEPLRNRKLLLYKKEMKKLANDLTEGTSIIPLRMFINDQGWAKLEIALAKGKKLYDKRESTKKREVDRELHRKFNTR